MTEQDELNEKKEASKYELAEQAYWDYDAKRSTGKYSDRDSFKKVIVPLISLLTEEKVCEWTGASVEHGEWVEHGFDVECNKTFHRAQKHNTFCPYCGGCIIIKQ